MTRLDELLAAALESDADPAAAEELRALVADPEQRARAILLLEIEARLRARTPTGSVATATVARLKSDGASGENGGPDSGPALRASTGRRLSLGQAAIGFGVLVVVSLVLIKTLTPRQKNPPVAQDTASVTPVPSADAVQATSADAFVDSLGVNTHLHYDNTIYDDFPTLKSALVSLGVRHARDGLVDSGRDGYFERMNELAATGLRFTLITDMKHERIIPVAEKVRNAIEAFEGPNEVNLNKWTVDDARDYQEGLWKTIKAGPFSKTPVLALSVTDITWAKELGDISAWCDFGNAHPYPGGWEPENGANWMRADLASGIETARAMCGDKPVMITETGYHSALKSSEGHIAISEAAAGVYLPRLFLNNYRSGVPRTFWYELFNSGESETDAESNFGLFKNDGVTIKPTGRALRQMIALLADPGEKFSPGKLDFKLSDPAAQSVLFQKRDGEFWLALWKKSSLWDESNPYGKKGEIDPADSECTVTLDGTIVSVTAHERLESEAPGSRSLPNPKTFGITLSERVLFLQIKTSINK